MAPVATHFDYHAPELVGYRALLRAVPRAVSRDSRTVHPDASDHKRFFASSFESTRHVVTGVRPPTVSLQRDPTQTVS